MITLTVILCILGWFEHKENKEKKEKEYQEWLERHDKYDERREFIHDAHREEDCGE